MTRPEPVCTVVPAGAGTVGKSTSPDLPRVEVKLTADAGTGFSVIEYTVPPGFSPPPLLHRQTREDTTIYIASGELHYWFADGEAHAGPGTVIRIPKGAWSRWANDGDTPCRLLLSSPRPGSSSISSTCPRRWPTCLATAPRSVPSSTGCGTSTATKTTPTSSCSLVHRSATM